MGWPTELPIMGIAKETDLPVINLCPQLASPLGSHTIFNKYMVKPDSPHTYTQLICNHSRQILADLSVMPDEIATTVSKSLWSSYLCSINS